MRPGSALTLSDELAGVCVGRLIFVGFGRLRLKTWYSVDKSVGKYREQLEVLSHFTIISQTYSLLF